MIIYKNDAFAPDPWDQTVAGPRPILTPEALKTYDGTASVGLRLDPGFDVESLSGVLDRVDLITIAFPKFTDGRGYSMAWLLRTQLDYTGELRAIGDVLFDEIQLMRRCGFDAFEIVDTNTLRLLREGRPQAFDRFYQPGLEAEIPEGTRPWARRLAATA